MRAAKVHTAATRAGTKQATATRHGLLVSLCDFSHRAPDDPIVHAGMPGMSHSHDFFGNTTTDSASTTTSLLAGTTTCRIAGDRAAYWAPTLSANGAPITPAGILAYYTRSTAVAPQPLPEGLEIVAGGRAVVRYSCFSHGMPKAQRMTPPSCGVGELLSIGVRFPDCWNGVDLDSADHRSHMAYSVQGVCPSTHSVAVPRLTVWMLYPHQERGATFTLSSGGMETAHADFFNAWVPHDYAALHQLCLVEGHTCYKDMYKVLTRLGLSRNLGRRGRVQLALAVAGLGPEFRR